MKIVSPMALGNGAYVVHKMLEEHLANYKVSGYNPYWTLFPPILPFLCKIKKSDLIHTTADYGCFFYQKNTPLVLSFHNFVLDDFMKPYSTLGQRIHYKTDLLWFTLKSLSLAQKVTSVSRFTAELVKKETGYDDIKVIYNGIDADRFKPQSTKKKGPVKVLFSGNLTRRKGAHFLPEIAKKLNPGIVIQYTRGLRTKRNQYYAPNMQDIGSVKFTDMPQIYQQADILLFPTVREGFGLVVAEAMASGLPIIATNCSSLPELITEGKGGYLCELGNVDDFACKINWLADSPHLRKEMGQYNRQRVEKNFSLGTMIKNYKELFEEILN